MIVQSTKPFFKQNQGAEEYIFYYRIYVLRLFSCTFTYHHVTQQILFVSVNFL